MQLSPQLKFLYFTANMLRLVSSGIQAQAEESRQSDGAADIEEIVDQWETVGGVFVVLVVVVGGGPFVSALKYMASFHRLNDLI